MSQRTRFICHNLILVLATVTVQGCGGANELPGDAVGDVAGESDLLTKNRLRQILGYPDPTVRLVDSDILSDHRIEQDGECLLLAIPAYSSAHRKLIPLLGEYARRNNDVAVGIVLFDRPRDLSVWSPDRWDRAGYRLTLWAHFRDGHLVKISHKFNPESGIEDWMGANSE